MHNYFNNLPPGILFLQFIPDKIINLLPFLTELNIELLVVGSIGNLMQDICRSLPILFRSDLYELLLKIVFGNFSLSDNYMTNTGCWLYR